MNVSACLMEKAALSVNRPPGVTMDEKEKLFDTIRRIPAESLDYGEWCKIGMAMKAEGLPYEAWDTWCQQDPARYDKEKNDYKWGTFADTLDAGKVGAGTIRYIAEQHGFIFNEPDSSLHFPTETGNFQMDTGTNTAHFPPVSFEAFNALSPVGQAVEQIRALFGEDEIVRIVAGSFFDAKRQKYIPNPNGYIEATAKEIINRLKAAEAENPTDALTRVLSPYGFHEEAGAWFYSNPLDGKGISDKNITEMRHILIESDEISIPEQVQLIRDLNLPVTTMTLSAGKSVHALVHVGALNKAEFRKKFDYIAEKCKEHLFTVDEANKNPARMSRLAGATRGNAVQTLLDCHIGKVNFKEWDAWISNLDHDPTTKTLKSLIVSLPAKSDLPPRAPELIPGVLRRGHKMSISGKSKAGKSFLLIELALCIATGGKWVNYFQCNQGRVLYVNLEIDNASFLQRVAEVAKAINADWRKAQENMCVMPLRGRPDLSNAERFTGHMLDEFPRGEYAAIIIDPIYKMGIENENDNSIVAAFLGQLDRIAEQTGASVIFCHHHSKGAQGFKSSIDRASGAGVFARDPDAIIDLLELDPPTYAQLDQQSQVDNVLLGNPAPTAWRLEFTLREFPPLDNVCMWWSYPRHYFDETGALKDADPMEKTIQQKGGQATKELKDREAFREAKSLKIQLEELATEMEWKNGEKVIAVSLVDFLKKNPKMPQSIGTYRTRANRRPQLYGWLKIRKFGGETYFTIDPKIELKDTT